MYERVRAGSSLSEAFEAQGTLFPGVYTASLLAGEKSGSLEQVIRRYVAYVKVVSGVKRKTISALVYPAILLGAVVRRGRHHRAAGRAGVRRVLQPVRPGAAAVDADHRRRSRSLPGTYFFADGARRIAAIVLGFVAWLKRPGNRRRFDKWTLGVPMLGPIAQKFSTSQAARTLATLLGGGIPLVNAIDVSARSIGNQYMAHELHDGGAAGPRGAGAGDGDAGRAARFPTSRSRWSRSASRPARCRRC